MKKLLLILIIISGLPYNLYAAGGSSNGNSNGGSSSGNSSGGSASSNSGGDNEGYGGNGQYIVSTKGVYDKALKAIWSQIQQEKYESALAELKKYVYENPENSDGWNLIGFTSRKLQKFDDAEIYYQTGLEIDPDHEGILQYQGELFLETNRLELAKDNLEKLKELCVFNCTEKNELLSLINSYEAN